MRIPGARLLAAGVLMMAAACTFDRQVIAVPASEVVVHGVLDPWDTLVSVLVERSLTGAISVPKTRFDPLDPINTSGGVPAAGAQVSITGPDGTAYGAEVQYPGKPATYGAGRYVFRFLTVRPGGRYALNIRTADGIIVTGSTVVPATLPGINVESRVFYRNTDTVSLNWQPVPMARTYGVRVESPFGAFQLFTDTTQLTLAGDLRNFFATDLPRVFIPGFRQAITIYAADTNFFDYYRSRNDPFTGSGIINRLQGGIGLFGSTVLLSTRTVDVTQATTDSTFEGEYDLVLASVPARTFVERMRLYIETPASGAVGASLSGWYTRPNFSVRDGIAGTRDGDSLQLDFLVNQNSQQHLVTFIGKQSHDSLIGTYRGMGGVVAFRKRPTP